MSVCVLEKKTEWEIKKTECRGKCACIFYVCVCVSVLKHYGSGGTETPNECVFVLQTPHTSVYLNMG